MLRLCLIVALLAASVCANAGPVFDDILNTMYIDQSLARSGDDNLTVSPDKPLGQTFITGDQTAQVCRIALHVAFWHDSWQPGESLVCTLWDSPEKKTQLGRFAIPYERRSWSDGVLMFSVESKVEPKHTYYFELTVDGGDRNIHGILMSKFDKPYPGGSGYQGGKPIERNLWFETYVKKPVDRDANLAEFFGNFDLELPTLAKVKAAVASKDWDTACREFLTHMESRKDLMNDEDSTPKLNPPKVWDQRESELVADMKFPALDGTVADLGPDWNYHATWPTLGGVGLTRTGLMKPLAWAYTATGDPKYARAWNDMLISMFRNVPNPAKSGAVKPEGKIGPLVRAGISGSLWDSISIAARLHHETFYNRFRKSPLFTEDARMAWWANVADMANLLERMDAGGNWTTQNTTALFSLGQKYPEFKKSKNWFAMGFEGLKQNLLDNMYPDGPCREAANYHAFSLGMFFGVITRGRELGLPVSEQHLQTLENAFSYTMYSTQPDWTMTMWGDSNRPGDPSGLLLSGGRYFKRPDMIWVGTKGKEGTKPPHDSIAFTQAGYYIMRSGWDPKARSLITRNGLSQSHYHHDQLSVQVQAYGSDLLPDPGVYAYGTPECNELVRTVSHSTISVDQKNISKGQGDNIWAALPTFDYLDATSPGYNELPGVRHRRRIMFLKPDYWVVADNVKGEGEHKSEQFWHFGPGKLDYDQATGAARTTNATGGNIAVIPLIKPDLAEQAEAVYAFSWEKVGKAPIARYTKSGLFPHTFLTVLYPYPAAKPAQVKAECLKTSDPSALAARIDALGSRDYVVFGEAGKKIELTEGKLIVSAAVANVRSVAKSGNITSFAWQDGTTLACGGKFLASCAAPVKALSVKLQKDTVRIDTDGPVSNLSVSTLGAKRAIVNGKEVQVAKGAKSITVNNN